MSNKAVNEILDGKFAWPDYKRKPDSSSNPSEIHQGSQQQSISQSKKHTSKSQSKITPQKPKMSPAKKEKQPEPQTDPRKHHEQSPQMELSAQFKEHLMKMQRFDRYMYPIQSDRSFKIPVEKQMKRLEKFKNSRKQTRNKIFDNELTVTALHNHVRLVYEMTRELQEKETLKVEIKTLQKTISELRSQKIQKVESTRTNRLHRSANKLNESTSPDKDLSRKAITLQTENNNLKEKIKSLERVLKEEDHQIQREKQTLLNRVAQLQEKNEHYQSQIAKLNFNAAEMMSEVGKIMSMENDKNEQHLASPHNSVIQKSSRISEISIHQRNLKFSRTSHQERQVSGLEKILQKWANNEPWEKDIQSLRNQFKGKLISNLQKLLKRNQSLQKEAQSRNSSPQKSQPLEQINKIVQSLKTVEKTLAKPKEEYWSSSEALKQALDQEFKKRKISDLSAITAQFEHFIETLITKLIARQSKLFDEAEVADEQKNQQIQRLNNRIKTLEMAEKQRVSKIKQLQTSKNGIMQNMNRSEFVIQSLESTIKNSENREKQLSNEVNRLKQIIQEHITQEKRTLQLLEREGKQKQSFRRERDELSSQISTLSTTMPKNKNETSKERTLLKEKQLMITEIKVKQQSLEKQIRKKDTELEDLANEKHSLESEVTDLRSKHQALLKSKDKTIASLQEKVEKLEKQRQELKGAVERSQDQVNFDEEQRERQKKQFTSKVFELEKNVHQQRSRHQTQREQLDKKIQQLNKQKQTLQDQIEDSSRNYKKQINILNQQLENSSATDPNKTLLHHQVDKLHSQLLQMSQTHQNEKSVMRKTIEQLNIEMQNLIMNSNEEKKQLREQIELVRNEEYKSWNQKMKKLRQELRTLQEDNERLVEIIQCNQNNFNKLVQENRFLQQKLHQAKCQKQQTLREIYFYKEKLEECERILFKLSPLQQKLKAFENAIDGTTTEQVNPNQTLIAMQRLCEQNQQMRAQLFSYKQDDGSQSKLLQMQSENQKLRSLNYQLQRDTLALRTKSAENLALNDDKKFHQLIEKYEKQLLDTTDMKSRLLYLQKVVTDKQTDMTFKHRDLQVLKQKLNQKSNQVFQLLKDKEHWQSLAKQYERTNNINETRFRGQIQNLKQKLAMINEKCEHLDKQNVELRNHQDKQRKLREEQKAQFNRHINQLEDQKGRIQKQLFERSHILNQKTRNLSELSTQLHQERQNLSRLRIEHREEISRVVNQTNNRGGEQVNRIITEVTEYRHRVDHQNVIVERQGKQINSLKSVEADLRRIIQQKTDKIESFTKENYQLRLAVAEKENSLQMTQSLSKVNHDNLSDKITELTKELHSAREESKRNQMAINREKQKLSHQIDRLREEIQHIQDQKNKQVKKLNFKLQEAEMQLEKARVSSSQFNVMEKGTQFRSQISIIQISLKQREGELAELKHQNHSLQSKNADLFQEIKELRQEKYRLQSHAKELEYEKSLNSNIQNSQRGKLEAKLSELTRQLSEKALQFANKQESLRQEVEGLRHKIRFHEQEKIDFDKIYRNISQHTELTHEKDHLLQQLRKSSNENIHLKSDLNHLESQLKIAKNENMNLKYSLNDQQQKWKMNELGFEHQISTQKENYEINLNHLTKENQSLHTRVRQLETDKVRLMDEKEEDKRRVYLNERSINDLQDRLSESLRHRSEIESSQKDVISRELQVLKTKNRELLQLNRAFKLYSQQSEVKARNYHGQIDQLKAQIRNLSKQLKSQTHKNNNDRQQNHRMRQELNGYQNNLQHENEKLNRKMKDFQFRSEQLIKDKNTLQALNRQLNFEKEKMKDQIQKLYRELEHKSQEYLVLRVSEKQLKREQQELRNLAAVLDRNSGQGGKEENQNDMREVNILWKISREVQRLIEANSRLHSKIKVYENSVSDGESYEIYLQIEKAMNEAVDYLVENEMVSQEDGAVDRFKAIEQIEEYLGESLPNAKYWNYLAGFTKDLLDNSWNFQLKYLELHQNVIKDIKLLFDQYAHSKDQTHLQQIQRCLEVNLDL